MRVAIDIRRMTEFGVGTYTRNIVRALGRLDSESKYFLIGPPEKVAEIGPLPPNFHTVPLLGNDDTPSRTISTFAPSSSACTATWCIFRTCSGCRETCPVLM